jgi:hypothetical protein
VKYVIKSGTIGCTLYQQEHLKERRFIEREVSHVQSVWENEGYANLDKIDVKIEKVICELKKWGGWIIDEEDEMNQYPKDIFDGIINVYKNNDEKVATIQKSRRD